MALMEQQPKCRAGLAAGATLGAGCRNILRRMLRSWESAKHSGSWLTLPAADVFGAAELCPRPSAMARARTPLRSMAGQNDQTPARAWMAFRRDVQRSLPSLRLSTTNKPFTLPTTPTRGPSKQDSVTAKTVDFRPTANILIEVFPHHICGLERVRGQSIQLMHLVWS
jgi:hypothetical protein